MGEQPDLTGMSNMPGDDELSSPPRPLLHRRKKVWLLGIVVTKLFHFPLAGIHLSHGIEDHIFHSNVHCTEECISISVHSSIVQLTA